MTPPIEPLTPREAKALGIRSPVSVRMTWPAQKKDLLAILRDLHRSGIGAALVMERGNAERGCVAVWRQPARKLEGERAAYSSRGSEPAVRCRNGNPKATGRPRSTR